MPRKVFTSKTRKEQFPIQKFTISIIRIGERIDENH